LVVCFVCLAYLDVPNDGTPNYALDIGGSPSMSKGALGWFFGV